MGLISYLKTLKESRKGSKILILGLDCAGKTTILKSVNKENIEEIKPTTGFNAKILKFGGIKFTIWDLGG